MGLFTVESKERRPARSQPPEPVYSGVGVGGGVPSSSPVPGDRSPVHCPVSPALEADVRDIRRLLKTYVSRLETKDAAARAAKEWRIVARVRGCRPGKLFTPIVARVLDRLFFFCYIGTIIVSMFMFIVFPGDSSYPIAIEPPDAEPATTPADYDDYSR